MPSPHWVSLDDNSATMTPLPYLHTDDISAWKLIVLLDILHRSD
jgi:hypothetical protein